MSKPKIQSPLDDKPEFAHLDQVDTLTAAGEAKGADLGEGLYKSRWDELSVWQAMWTFRRSSFYTFMVYTAYIIDGYEVTMSGSIIANQGFMRQFGELNDLGEYKIDKWWVSAWGAIINVGQIISMTHIAWVADRFGRRNALYLGWFYALICLVVMTVSRSPPVWLIAKLVVGMSVGVSQVVVTPYVTEIAPVRCRGAMIAIGMVWQSIGSITCSVMMTMVNRNHPDFWLLPIYIEYGLIAVMLGCYVCLPETPWYYGRRENREGCFKSMKRLYGNVDGYDYEEEYGIILRTIAHEKEMLAEAKTQSWTQVFRGLNGKRMFILLVMCTGQQVGGNALISVYSTYFFQQAGMDDPFTATMIQTCMALLAVIIYVGIIDRVGRRWPVCIAYTILTVMLWLIGALYYAQSAASETVLLILVCIWQPCFSLYTKSYYIIASELPSLQLRMKTGTFVWFYQALWGIVLTFAAPPLLDVGNVRAAFLFAGLSVPVTTLLWLYLPETKARSVAEMDELFEKRVPAWRTSKYTTDVEIHLKAFLEQEKRAMGTA